MTASRPGRGGGRVWLAIGLLAAALALAGAAGARGADGADAVRRLGRGVNVLGYDPVWSGGPARVAPSDFAAIRRHGFSHVRINLFAFAHMDEAGQLDPRWLATLDRMVAAARAAGLTTILDEHDFQLCAAEPATCRAKLVAFWRQVGARYRDQPGDLLFELLNEPHGAMSGPLWNQVLREALAAVRATNPRRTVVVGPDRSNAYQGLSELDLPDDPGLLVSIHYYEPLRFTHQGAAWSPMAEVSGVAWGTPAERDRVARDLATAAAWGRAHGRGMLLGEFGAYDRAALPDRVAWTRTVARAAEAEGMAWTYWQFEGTFGLYDPASRKWSGPLLDALHRGPP